MTRAVEPIGPVFDHLRHLTDANGLFEHALLSEPRPEHGYCVDDTARALVVLSREPQLGPTLQRLATQFLDVTLDAVQPDGTCHNRMSSDGAWVDEAGVGDWWGRALWGLGVAAGRSTSATTRARAVFGFRAAAAARTPHVRAIVFAGLGAGELLLTRPDELVAQQLLRVAADRLLDAETSNVWPWPEPRLTYANGAVVECLLLAGDGLGDVAADARGLELLDFLLEVETRDGHLSVTPVGGRGPEDAGPGFDQQPIEVAALAAACARAYALSPDPRWLNGIILAWDWFLGDNDAQTPMFDPATGGGYDGLHEHGRNLNQGAESTLAMLSTAQHARDVGLLR